jgi:excisionase family DNA binding protein
MATLTIPEVAAQLQISPKTAYQLARSGSLPTVRLGPRLLRVRQETLDAYLRAREVGGAEVAK